VEEVARGVIGAVAGKAVVDAEAREGRAAVLGQATLMRWGAQGGSMALGDRASRGALSHLKKRAVGGGATRARGFLLCVGQVLGEESRRRWRPPRGRGRFKGRISRKKKRVARMPPGELSDPALAHLREGRRGGRIAGR